MDGKTNIGGRDGSMRNLEKEERGERERRHTSVMIVI